MTNRGYPAGWPFWRALARHGVPIRVHVEVMYDPEAEVYVALNSNLKGLIAEAPDVDQLIRNLDLAAKDLLETYLHEPPTTPPITSYTMVPDCAPA